MPHLVVDAFYALEAHKAEAARKAAEAAATETKKEVKR
jgi:hypothetical protein